MRWAGRAERRPMVLRNKHI